MDLDLTPEQDAFLRRAVEDGRFARREDALRNALDAWVERERQREELLAAIDRGEEDLARGDLLEFDSAQSLADDVIGRGMARLKDAVPGTL